MDEQTKGKCKYCGKEYIKASMLRHLPGCKERKARIAEETGSRRCGYFELAIYGKYDKEYWLIVEVRDDAKLKDLDSFLRDIWLECCGHLSAFDINGDRYAVLPVKDSFWGMDEKGMGYKLKSVLEKGMTFEYEYDFGSTTDLILKVHDYREGWWKMEKMTILSRNNPPKFLCDTCCKNEATVICAECIYDGEGFLCDDCKATHECGADMQRPVCNAPRMGVCGYEGSRIYPDQFMPDEE